MNSRLDFSAGSGVRVGGNFNQVYNTLITNTGYMGSYATAISLSGSHNSVSHNTIHDAGRDGITVDWHVNGLMFRDNDISYNRIYHASLLATDSGGIYLCCRLDATGTTIHHNWVYGAVDTRIGSPPGGLYIDNSSSNVHLFQNVVWDNGGYGIIVHGDGKHSRGNIVEFNTAFGRQTHSIDMVNISDAEGTRVENNRLSVPPTIDRVAANIRVVNNSSDVPGAMNGIAASVGCNMPGCGGQTPQFQPVPDKR